MRKRYDFFVSYSSKDHELTKGLVTDLRRRRRSVWWDRNLKGEFRDELAQAILASRAVIVLVTKDSVLSQEVKKEIEFAQRRKVRIVPLILGDPLSLEGAEGFALSISTTQWVPAATGELSPEIIDECIRVATDETELSSPDPQHGPPVVELDPLAIESRDIPSFSTSESFVLRACYEFFVRCTESSSWKEARQLLTDMKKRRVLPVAQPEQFTALERWLAWVQWYDEARLRAGTWGELVRDLLQKGPELPPQGSLKGVCPPVAERLEAAFWRTLDASLEAFQNGLAVEDGSGASALASLEMLGPDLLKPLAGLFEENPLLRGKYADEDLLDWARQALLAYVSTPEGDVAARFQDLLDEPLPPEKGRLVTLREEWQRQERGRMALARFCRLLSEEVAPRCGGDASAAARLLLHFDLVGCSGATREEEPELDAALDLLTTWNQGLEALCSERVPVAFKHLERAGELYPSAGQQAGLVRSWDEVRDRVAPLLTSPIAEADWNGARELLARAQEATAGLLKNLVQPLLAVWRSAPGGRRRRPLDSLASLEERLGREARSFAQSGWLIRALSPLRAGDVAGARSALAAAPDAEARTAAEPWLAVCEAADRLLSELEPVPSLAREGGLADEGAGLPLLDIPDEQLAGIERHGANAIRLLAAAREGHAIFGSFRLPAVEIAEANLKSLAECRSLWGEARDLLAAAEPPLEEGSRLQGALQCVEGILGPMPAAEPARRSLETWLAAEESCRSWREEKSQGRWRAAQQGLTGLRSCCREVREGLGPFEKSWLDEALRCRLEQLEQELADCEAALKDEERLREALARMEAGKAGEALGLFNQMQTSLPAMTLWHRVANALDELEQVREEQVLERLEVDRQTGLPPEEHTLAAAEEQLKSIRDAAGGAVKRIEEARRAGTGFDCSLPWPARIFGEVEAALARLEILRTYRQALQTIQGDLDRQDWASAGRKLRAFIHDFPQELDGPFKVLKALQIGESAQTLRKAAIGEKLLLKHLREADLTHPLLAPLRQERQTVEERLEGSLRVRFSNLLEAASRLCALKGNDSEVADAGLWLTMPVLANRSELKRLEGVLQQNAPAPADLNRAIDRLLKAAGVNRSALLTAAGEIEEVEKALRADRKLPPHDLAAAGFARLGQRREQTEPEVLARTISVCALFACCGDYREALAERLGRELPPGLRREDRSVRARVRSELELAFGQAAMDWGQIGDPASWACRFEAECFAVSRLLLGGGCAPLPWPFGPALVRFYGLEKDLDLVLRRDETLRSWYGPCAAAEAMLWSGDPQAALAHLPGAGADPGEASGYRYLDDPAEALRRDADRVRSDAWFSLLNRCHFRADTGEAQAEEICAEMVACCRKLLELRDAGAPIEGRLEQTLSSLFGQMLDQIQKPEVNLGRKAGVEDARARKRCMDGVLALLQERSPASRLTRCTHGLQALRASLVVRLVDLEFDHWRLHGQPRALLEEMGELTEQAIQDAPNNPRTHIAKAEILMIRGVATRDGETFRTQAQQYLERLELEGARRKWPPGAIAQIRELHELAQSTGDLPTWIRQQRLRSSELREEQP